MKCCREHLVIIIQCQLTQIFLTTCCRKDTTTFPELHQFSFSFPLYRKNKALTASYYKSQKPCNVWRGGDKIWQRNTCLRQAFWVRAGMESSHLQEPATTIEIQTPSYIPKELWSTQPREQSSCGKDHLWQELHGRMWSIHQNGYQLS